MRKPLQIKCGIITAKGNGVNETQLPLGSQALYVAQRIPALVTVVGTCRNFGRLDVQVRDCLGGTTWVAAHSLQIYEATKPTAAEKGEQ